MPHSVGGGSHHGGSHSHHSGSSHHSSSVSRSSSSHKSSSYSSKSSYSGRSSRYERRSSFADGLTREAIRDQITGGTSGPGAIPNTAAGCLKGCLIIFMLPFILPVFIGLALIFGNVDNEKISTDKYDAGTYIEDNANILGDTSELELAMDDLLDRSGVSAAVVTIDNRVWQDGRSYTNDPDLYLDGPYYDIEQYAHDLYNDMFDDEYHILVVYSTNTEIVDSENWDYEIIAGDKIDSSIPDSKIEEFDVDLYARLLDINQGPDVDLTDSFNEFTDNLNYVKFPFALKLLLAGFCFFFAFIAVFIVVKVIKAINRRKDEAAAGTAFPISTPYGVSPYDTGTSAPSSPYGVNEIPDPPASSYGSSDSGSTPVTPSMPSTPYGANSSTSPYGSAGSSPAPTPPYIVGGTSKPAEPYGADTSFTPSAHSYDKSLYEEEDDKVDGLFSGLFKKRDDDYE